MKVIKQKKKFLDAIASLSVNLIVNNLCSCLECPGEWDYWEKTGKCYKMFTNELTWMEAQFNCTSLGVLSETSMYGTQCCKSFF